jgi:membrane-associated HD superfamily phosphohydrolase
VCVVSCRGSLVCLRCCHPTSNTFEKLTAKRQPGCVFKSKLAQDLNEEFYVNLYQILQNPSSLSKEQAQYLRRKCTKTFKVETRDQFENKTISSHVRVLEYSSAAASSHNSKVLTIVNPIQQPNKTYQSCQAEEKEEKALEREAPSVIERCVQSLSVAMSVPCSL